MGGAMLEFDDYAKSDIRRSEFVREAVKACECLVAVESGSVVGYLVLKHDFFENGFVSLVVVSPAFQRQGIALRLLAASELVCKTSKLFTSASTSDIASRKLIAGPVFRQAALSKTWMRTIRNWFISSGFGEWHAPFDHWEASRLRLGFMFARVVRSQHTMQLPRDSKQLLF
ncbi:MULTISPECIES: GNAT family N-acetyltransferase [Pseudomonas]|uniref:GNAT family N-acetyltransferase n=1 Tax=Pseudomonas TaxID=286 RepID=UPI002E824893|nr:GNAT family N-acetyltransferase [Pseudomonas sp. Z18(2022)]